MKSGKTVETAAPPRRFRARVPEGYVTIEECRAFGRPKEETPAPVEPGTEKPRYYIER